MKAIVYRRYGSPDVLRLEDLDTPTLGEDGVLVRVRASSVNAVDWHSMRGQPLLVRMTDGLRRPKHGHPGVDVAGQVEAVGASVTEFRPGDEIFGARSGAFAEFVLGAERNFAPKPANLTFEQAAAIPVAATTALQGLRDRGELQPGQRVLVHGAGGGVGHFAVQIAKALGAEVTGVSAAQNLEMIRSIGADEVIDSGSEDFTRLGRRYDLILDIAGTRSLSATARALTRDGSLVVVGGPAGRWISPADRWAKAIVLSRLGKGKLLTFLARTNKADLVVLKELAEAGKLTPVIDRTYPLEETPAAIRYVETMRARGKVVITV
jgi:NADPH:quinone reductase-like Zn-dependent oxidoreductase